MTFYHFHKEEQLKNCDFLFVSFDDVSQIILGSPLKGKNSLLWE